MKTLLVLFAAVIAARSESMQRWSDLEHAAELRKFSNNATKLADIWSDCSSSGDSVKILSVSVTPDPPEKGQKVMADVKLQFTEEVEGGSLNILVKYKNYFPVMNKKEDLCNIPNILSESCPLQAGTHDATFVQTFPSYAPYGTYVGKVVAKDKSGNELMCMKLNFSV